MSEERMKINRFQVIDIDNRGTEKVGIKDHLIDKSVVLLNVFEKKEDNISLAEDIISVIETHLQEGELDGGED